jgi:uncharacterized membrane protein
MNQWHTHQATSETTVEEKVRKVELLISNLLRFGVLASLVLIVGGTLLSLAHHSEYLTSGVSFHRFIEPTDAVPHSLAGLATGLKAFSGTAIAVLGILLLIATPVVRVGVSIFAFIYQRDRLYTLITATVFCLLLLSFVLGKVE